MEDVLARIFKRSVGIGLIALMMAVPMEVQAKPWITAYVGGWWLNRDDDGAMPISKIDFRGMTVCDHMALLPTASFPFIDTAVVNNWVTNSMFLGNSLKLTAAAHAAHVKCIFTIGAWSSESAFLGATSPSNLPRFINSLVNFLKQRRYDGIDIDWEPLRNSDVDRWKDLIIALRNALPSPGYLITVTAGWGSPAGAYASIQNYVDQINIMTYDFDTDASGYNSWYAASVYSDGVVDPFDNETPVPSCSYMVGLFEKAGVKPSKLGIGCEPGGDLWTGITGPNQSISTVTSWKADISYNTIMSRYYKPGLYHWDAGAAAAYLSFDTSSTAGDWFLSYDDPRALEAKLDYVKSAGIGGLIIYEIGLSYDQKTGKNPFLEVTRKFLRR
jgi:GH18 family chitinase